MNYSSRIEASIYNPCERLQNAHLNLSIESIKTTSMETVSTGVLDKNKEHYLRSKDIAENDVIYQDIYNWICQNTKKWRYTIHYVKSTAQLLLQSRFPKGKPAYRKQVVNPLNKSFKKP